MKKLVVVFSTLLLLGCAKSNNKEAPSVQVEDKLETNHNSVSVDSKIKTTREESLPSGDVAYNGSKTVDSNEDELLKLLSELYDMKIQSKDELLNKLDKLKEFDVIFNVDDVVKLYSYTTSTDDKRIATASSRVLSSDKSSKEDVIEFTIKVRFAQSPTYGESVESISNKLYDMLRDNDELPIRDVVYTFDKTTKKLELTTKSWLFNAQ